MGGIGGWDGTLQANAVYKTEIYSIGWSHTELAKAARTAIRKSIWVQVNGRHGNKKMHVEFDM